jgi:hypothetical protein
LPGVFDNPGAFGDGLRGVNAATMHARLANLDPPGWLSSFGFLRHAAELRIKKEEGRENKRKSK